MADITKFTEEELNGIGVIFDKKKEQFSSKNKYERIGIVKESYLHYTEGRM